jgi:hypothetical protein
MTTLIGNKRQRSGSEEAETGMATEDEGDEEANNSSGGDKQGGDRQHRVGGDRQDGDRQDGESEGNSIATRTQRLGSGGKAGVLT